MKQTFSTAFIKANRGCYTEEDLQKAYINNNKTSCYSKSRCTVTINDILNSNISLKDKYWFFCNNVFSKKQNQEIAIKIAQVVLPIFEKRYPHNKSPRKAIQTAKKYLKGEISKEELKAAADAAYAAYAAAAYAYAYAAYAAYAAAAAAYAYAADTAAAYAAAADTAAADAADKNYNKKLFTTLRSFIKKNS